MTLALYDAGKGVKISEDFHVDLNSPYIRQLVPPPDGTTDDGPHPLSQKATRATEVSCVCTCPLVPYYKYSILFFQAVFSVTIPSSEIYLVAKVEKILQGGISACVEPYMKAGENPKVHVHVRASRRNPLGKSVLMHQLTVHVHVRSENSSSLHG